MACIMKVLLLLMLSTVAIESFKLNKYQYQQHSSSNSISNSNGVFHHLKNAVASIAFSGLVLLAPCSSNALDAAINDNNLATTSTKSTTSTTLKDKAAPLVTAVDDSMKNVDIDSFKLPYEHQNLPFKQFLGKKATIIFNMKIDDPQTMLQFPSINEIYAKYSKDGLNAMAFPTEQGWFEPDDDETCRAKAKEYYLFGEYPNAVVFDKIDLLGPSQHPFYAYITRALPTPNGYNRITLNYEKFLLDSEGFPVRRYPRKYSVYDMEPDIQALLAGQKLPDESPAFLKAWREAKREAVKNEYSFRYNYNYYTSPDSMYKYDEKKDVAPPTTI